AAAAPLDEEALWQRLDERLSFAGEKSHWRLGGAAWVGALGAVAAATLLFLWHWQGALVPQVSYDGIKGRDFAQQASLKALRFALVGEAGSLIPGEDNMEVKVGTPLVFSLESVGADAK